MDMTPRILASATLLTVFCGAAPAVDPQLLSLAMPDAVAMADVNVVTAKASPFGQYVVGQIASASQFAAFTAQVGFDPTQDLNEILVANNGTPKTGLVLASGTFNVSAISTAAAQAGTASEIYNGVTILEDPKKEHGFAFLGSSIAIAGDIASVKAAIGRQGAAPGLPSQVVSQINALSGADDAWFLTTVPPASLEKHAGTTSAQPPSGTNGLLPPGTAQNILKEIQAANGGVKFGGNVQFSAQAQTDNAQDATALAGVIQLLANLAQANSTKNPQGAAALKSLTVSASGATVNLSLTLPEDQFQQLFTQSHAKRAALRK